MNNEHLTIGLMKKFFVLFLFFSGIIFAQNVVSIPTNFYKRFEGNIAGKYKITMQLFKEDTLVKGSYFYNNIGQPIEFWWLKSKIDDAGNIYLEETTENFDTNYQMIPSGIFKGKFVGENKIEGEWFQNNSNKKLPFSLTESYPEGSAKFDIIYKTKSYKDASIKIAFPLMKDFPDSSVQNNINDFINSVYQFSFGDTTRKYSSIEEVMDAFIQSYKDEVENNKDLPEDYHPQYFSDFNLEVLLNQNYILSFKSTETWFEGGAHPLTNFNYLSFNLHTGKEINLDDIFKPGYKKKFNEIGEEIFRKHFDLEKNKSLNDQGFWFDNDFKLNENFSFQKGGIEFLFNPYEVAAYAYGAIKIFIKYSDVKDYIKDASILNELLK